MSGLGFRGSGSGFGVQGRHLERLGVGGAALAVAGDLGACKGGRVVQGSGFRGFGPSGLEGFGVQVCP